MNYTVSIITQESRPIACRTAWCRCKFRYVSKLITTTSRGFHRDSTDFVFKQESWAIAQMTARCALYMVPWKFSRVR